MTTKQLQKLYAQYNKKYFDSKLPAEIPISFVDMSQTDKAGLHICYQEPGMTIHAIHLDSTFKEYDTLLKFFLLHECCHVSLFPREAEDPHGQLFDEEMARIMIRGAFHGIW
jgi:hypothetical protein